VRGWRAVGEKFWLEWLVAASKSERRNALIYAIVNLLLTLASFDLQDGLRTA